MENLRKIANFMTENVDKVNEQTYYGTTRDVDNAIFEHAPSYMKCCKAKTIIEKVEAYESRTNWLEMNGGEDWVTTRGYTFSGKVEITYVDNEGNVKNVTRETSVSLPLDPWYLKSSQLEAIGNMEKNGVNDEDMKKLMFGIGCSTQMVLHALADMWKEDVLSRA